ncbi:ATP-dependent helicase/nuclease subunit A [Striga asiatica]|uniref:ATP-dependent helicase/nuclease subunit A n=1 Tax=Striga asiatica TaxID=4170 RepID=A0A5A7PLH6_STRAF|nr:ATP-dependent helicase/nuclease subunit A [Striga asiatica]
MASFTSSNSVIWCISFDACPTRSTVYRWRFKRKLLNCTQLARIFIHRMLHCLISLRLCSTLRNKQNASGISRSKFAIQSKQNSVINIKLNGLLNTNCSRIIWSNGIDFCTQRSKKEEYHDAAPYDENPLQQKIHSLRQEIGNLVQFCILRIQRSIYRTRHPGIKIRTRKLLQLRLHEILNGNTNRAALVPTTPLLSGHFPSGAGHRRACLRNNSHLCWFLNCFSRMAVPKAEKPQEALPESNVGTGSSCRVN